MMAALAWLLWPITTLMDWVLHAYMAVFSSVGVAIMLLSITFSVLLLPLVKRARVIEQRTNDKMKLVASQISAEKGNLKGEALFNLTEKIYQRNNFHPIQGVMTGLSLFVMLPVLIASILLLTTHGLLQGVPFLFIPDLSQPDHLLAGINALPLIMFALTAFDAFFRYRNDPASMRKFMFVSVVLVVLVYNMAAGLVLYWITSNLVSFSLTLLRPKARP